MEKKLVIGQKFGKLTVERLHHTKQIFTKGIKNGLRYYYLCRCDCGKGKIASLDCLKNGHTISCGCARKGMGLKDITGLKFGRLKVISYQGRDKKQTKWLCKCNCGNTLITSSHSLISGATKSCGCLKKQKNSKTGRKKLNDLTGKKFGLLTVIRRAKNKGKDTMWLCKCECGKDCVVGSQNLKKEKTKSCGCLRFRKGLRIKHGLANTKLYKVFAGMKRRCYVNRCPEYKHYGGRGITVCKEWLNDFVTFYSWAMAKGYKEGLTIERINNDGNYEPSNCKWASMKTQCKNRRSNVIITYKNEKHTLQEWSRKTGVDTRTIKDRIKKYGLCDKVFYKENVQMDRR